MKALALIQQRFTPQFAQLITHHVSSAAFNGSLSQEVFAQLCKLADCTPIRLAHELLPLVAEYAYTPISSFQVAAIAMGNSGAVYFGANIEFIGSQLGQSIHAEQAAVVNAWMQGEEGIREIVVSASPCGHCRQFLNELTTAPSLTIHITDHPSYQLTDLLKQSFGPSDLAVEQPFLMPVDHQYKYQSDDDIEMKAVEALNKSYTPYTHSPSGVCIQTHCGASFVGAYVENAAYNPTLSPLHVAIVQLRMSGFAISDIARVVLAETSKEVCLQYQVTNMLINAMSAEIAFTHITV